MTHLPVKSSISSRNQADTGRVSTIAIVQVAENLQGGCELLGPSVSPEDLLMISRALKTPGRYRKPGETQSVTKHCPEEGVSPESRAAKS